MTFVDYLADSSCEVYSSYGDEDIYVDASTKIGGIIW